jgi:hypothetical protein
MHASHSKSSSALNAQDHRGSPLPGTCSSIRRGAQNSIRRMHNKGHPSGNPGRHRQEARGGVYRQACTSTPGARARTPSCAPRRTSCASQVPRPPDPARRRRHWLGAIARRGADRAAPATPSVHPLGGTGRAHLGFASGATSRCEKRPPMPASPKTACGGSITAGETCQKAATRYPAFLYRAA